MKSSTLLSCMLLLAAFAAAEAHAEGSTAPAAERTAAMGSAALNSLSYVENRGQWDREARFLVKGSGLDLWITNSGITYDLHKEQGALSERNGHVVRMSFVGASRAARATATTPMAGTVGYYLNGRAVEGVRRYNGVRIANLYPGIDAVMYLDNGSPRYDFILAPGADPSRIRMKVEGAGGVSVDGGELVYETSVGQIRQGGLFAYQGTSAGRSVDCSFRKNADGTIGFNVGRYDRSKPLVIDPLVYSTLIATAEMETPYDIAVDMSGNVYITGMTQSTTFPATTGAYKTAYQGGSRDAFVAKLDPTGSRLLWATFLGGSGQDIAYAIAVSAQNEVYVTGTTTSPNFPTSPNAYQTTLAASGGNSFVTKLDSNGAAILYSTYIQSVAAIDIEADTDGKAYVTGSATSGFTATTGAMQTVHGGGNADAFVLKVNVSGTGLDWATLIGGRGSDRGTSLTVGTAGAVYVTGTTDNAAGFPISANAFQNTVKGNLDIFVVKLGVTGAGYTYSTLLGGSLYDISNDIAIDGEGNAYLTGTTKSLNFPLSANPVQDIHAGSDDGANFGDVFVTKLNTTGTNIVYSTYLGGGTGDGAYSIAVDVKGQAYIAGFTGSPTFPTAGAETDIVQQEYSDSGDAFYAKFTADGSDLLYATLLGGEGPDTATAIALDQFGGVYIAGHTRSLDFPTTEGAYGVDPGDKKDIFVAKLPGIQIGAPNGGEVWCAGGTHLITWATSGIPSVDIYISSDSGRSYNLLAAGVNGGSYLWPVPQTQAPGTKYRIRIQENGSNFRDLGDTTFTIQSFPAVLQSPSNTTQPAGGIATFTAGASGTPAAEVIWQVSADTGKTWTVIPNETGTTLRVRNLTAGQSGNLYRAIFTNACGSVESDAAMLTVVAVTVTEPIKGTRFCAGSTLTVRWDVSGFTGTPSYSISYSADSGTTWSPIVSNIVTNSYDWKIPTNIVPSTKYRIRVTLSSGGVIDITDSTFTVNARANVMADPDDVSAESGMTVRFTSRASGLPEPTVQWQVSTNNGQSWTNVAGGTRALVDGGIESGYSVTNVGRADSGSLYRTIYTNECGSDTTLAARVSVFSDNPTGVDDPTGAGASLSMSITPNPSRGNAELRFTLPRSGAVRVVMTDMTGRLVRELVDRSMTEGEQIVRIDGSSLPNGTYACTLFFNGLQRTVNVVIVR